MLSSRLTEFSTLFCGNETFGTSQLFPTGLFTYMHPIGRTDSYTYEELGWTTVLHRGAIQSDGGQTVCCYLKSQTVYSYQCVSTLSFSGQVIATEWNRFRVNCEWRLVSVKHCHGVCYNRWPVHVKVQGIVYKLCLWVWTLDSWLSKYDECCLINLSYPVDPVGRPELPCKH